MLTVKNALKYLEKDSSIKNTINQRTKTEEVRLMPRASITSSNIVFCTAPKIIKNKIIQFAANAKIELADRNPRKSWAYDGKTIATQNTLSNLIHDISHYLVCPPWRRVEKDFGLGAGPESNSIRAIVDETTAKIEEEQASLLGILIERQFKLDWIETMRYHGWLKAEDVSDFSKGYEMLFTNEELKNRLQTLINEGLLSDNLKITASPNIIPDKKSDQVSEAFISAIQKSYKEYSRRKDRES